MVKAWTEDVVIPTYECGKFEKNPIFLEKRVYQGSSGRVYPYPVIEAIADEKTDHTYACTYIENEYIKVMVLPELGGRIQMAYDKVKQRHFVYYNHVIKPALVGLAGPWISGGIEFNWPQHHRPSTFLPVDTSIEEHEDGSVTVWVNETERMSHQKGMAGFTLRPGKAYLEIEGVLYNRTKLPQTFLWWANPAVAVNDYYQSVFPQDINAVFDHGKRAVSTFPVATGTYYKMDYSAGVDISNYKNIKVPTSYMGVNSKFDFEGGYENDTRAGMLHVADHHVSPGKKQWTWGNGDFGRAWDRNLTDEDGPYIELMAGVYTENQPDFAWIQPGEEKRFTQYFMPYRELGVVKNATKDLCMNILSADGGKNRLKIFATGEQHIRIIVKNDDGTTYFDEERTLSPHDIFDEVIDTKKAGLTELNVVIDAAGQTALRRHLMTWHAESDEVKRIPDAAEAAPSPKDTKTVEQLYLTGLHLEQYRHATWNPADYYEEGLRRDPDDVRCNNATGLRLLRDGRPEKAEPYLRRAVEVLQKRNPNPYDGEPLYNLALALKFQGKTDEAYDMFYKATWNGAWQNAAYYACAQISTSQGRLDDALHETERAMDAGWHHHQNRALRIALLRMTGRRDEALQLAKDSLAIDKFNYGALYEKYLIEDNSDDLQLMIRLMHGNALNYHETAIDYAQAGLWQEAVDILKVAIDVRAVNPMTHYYIGYALRQLGRDAEASEAVKAGEREDSYCCFPNRLEDILVLRCAIELNRDARREAKQARPDSSHAPSAPGEAGTGGGKAPYYLGCLFYDKRQYDEAVSNWELSRQLNPAFPTVWRNLALAAFNKEHNPDKALDYMERAFSLDTTDARILMELDLLRKVMQQPFARRLGLLRQHEDLVRQRDDLVLEKATLLNQLGRYDEAREVIDARRFHPWEGGEGKVAAQYQICRMEKAKRLIAEGDYEEAVRLLEECLVYPEHLGEGKLYGAQENDFYYYMGEAFRLSGNPDEACRRYEQALIGPVEPAGAMYYNDAKPDKIFFSGLAYRRLAGMAATEEERRILNGKADGVFHRFIAYGEKHIFDVVKTDYFAVSLPDLLIWESSLQQKNTEHCEYMLALGHYGIGDLDKARKYCDRVVARNINHQGAQALRAEL